jgi:Flp pilus assembly protein TadG
MQCLRKLWSRFAADERGSALPLIGVSIFVLLGSTGIAVDMGRVQMAQSRMSAALDAAGLAAGANVSTVDLNQEVTKYFNANYPTGYMGTQVTGLTVSGDENLTVLTLRAEGVVPMTFMQLFGITSMPIDAEAEITRYSSGMELVLVLDTTGSMSSSSGSGQSKMDAAKTASATLLNSVYGNLDVRDNLWVGVVPFSQSVNVGSARADWSQPDTFNWGPTSWQGCVDAREADNRDVTDDPPTAPNGVVPERRFPKYYWPDDSNNDWIGSALGSPTTTTICNRNSSCTCSNFGPCTTTTTAQGTVAIACSGSGNNRSCTRTVRNYVTTYNISSTRGPNKMCNDYPIQPLVRSKTTVINAVNQLEPEGNTHIGLGAAWAWRLLSPRWQNYWGGDMNANQLPLAYNTPLMSKVVVLMTDGDNTIDSNNWGSYWYLNAGKLGTTNQSAAVTSLNNRLLTTCTNMKNNGIIVYTVAFGTSISTSARNMLQACASRPEYYFYSPTGATLQASFRQIGDSLANLRISR